ncbi:hypothetical protein M0R45_013053 [Rubus argutus]|uniref:Protein kinase domain-containing protein n=1 Tax=Rubus argutus TaxID=59490 RepID=A0AAW1XHB2_RUBAR
MHLAKGLLNALLQLLLPLLLLLHYCNSLSMTITSNQFIKDDVRNGGSGCMTWYGDLMDTTQFTQGQGQDLYIRADALVLAKYKKKSNRFLAKKGMVLILVFPPIAMIFLIFFGCWCSRRKTKGSLRERKQYGSRTNKDLEYFDLRSIVVATDNFSTANKLGEGGFGSVYKGLLANGEEIAVKRLSKNSGQAWTFSYLIEVAHP